MIRDLSGGPVLNTDLPEGQYSVTLTASGSNGVQLTTNKSITVKDWLIVSMGDSYGGGEGNPHQAQQFDLFAFPTSAKRPDSADGAVTARTSPSPPIRFRRFGAGRAGSGKLRSEIIRHVRLPQSHRANIHSLVYGPQSSVDSSDFSTDPDQLTQLRSLVGPRQVHFRPSSRLALLTPASAKRGAPCFSLSPARQATARISTTSGPLLRRGAARS